MGLFDFARARKKQGSGDMVFKDNASAFEYACNYLDSRVVVGETLLALVEKVEPLRDGRQRCTLRLESDEGGRELLFCETLNKQVPVLQVGDLVAYGVAGHVPHSKSKIAQLSISGFIVTKLRPVWSVQHSGWREWSG